MKPHRFTSRLTAAFCLLAGALWFVGWQGISHFRQLNAEMETLFFDKWEEQRLTHDALRTSDMNSRITLLIFMTDSPDEIQSLLAQRSANTDRITGLMGQLEPRLEGQRETALFDAIKTTRPPYVDSYVRALELLLNEHKRDEARRMMVEVVRPNLMAYHSAWTALDQYETEEIKLIAEREKAENAAGVENSSRR